jgi:heme exporter protein D
MSWLHWGSVDAFLAMGGYAPYVWGAYGLTTLALALEGWLTRRRARRAREAARRAREAARRAAGRA